MATAQDAFERVAPQELLTHLRVTHFRCRLRLFHPQRTVHLRQFFPAHPVGQKTKITHHPEELFRYMLLQPTHDFPLRQPLGGLLTCIVVVVTKAQRGTAGVVRQPGAGYRWFFQIPAQVFHGVFTARRLF